MDQIVLILMLLVTFCESSNDYSGQFEANMNEYMDLLMADASPWIKKNGLDPLRLHEITNQFEYKPVFGTYHGRLHLSNGVLHNLRNITRNGNSAMHYGYKLMRIETGVSITNLNFRYDYDVNVMNLGWHGWIDGRVTNLNLQANFIVDLTDFYIYIQDFHVISIGSLDVRVRGNSLTDWLGNIIIKVVTAIFKTKLVNYVSVRVHEMAQITIDGINSRMSIYDRREVAAKFFNDIEIETMLIL